LSGLSCGRRDLWRRIVPCLAIVALAGCEVLSPRTPIEGCHETVSVQVDLGPAPAFNWMPGCGVSRVVVMTPDPSSPYERVVWAFFAPESDPVGPGVRYGVSPRRATVWTQPEPLEAGRQYRVIVTYTVGEDVRAGGGEAVFTWQPD
jgi:hypothetical protein